MPTTIVLLSVLSHAAPQTVVGPWTLQNPRWCATNLQCVEFIDNNTGWVGGDNGTVLATADGGATWTARNLPLLNLVRDLSFSDEDSGWAAGGVLGHALLARTTDGGGSWITVDDVPLSEFAFTRIYFRQDGAGFVLSRNRQGQLLRTSDRGNTWTAASIAGCDALLADIAFIDPDTGYLCGDKNYFARTFDGGEHWHPIDIGSAHHAGPYESIAAFPPDTIFLVGWEGVLRSTDAGASWRRVLTLAQGERLWSSAFMSSTQALAYHGFAPSRAVSTTDGGQTWDTTTTTVQPEIHQVLFTQAPRALAVDASGGMHVVDPTGAVTQSLNPHNGMEVRDLDMTPSGHGLAAVPASHQLLVTADGGSQWTTLEFAPSRPTSVLCLSPAVYIVNGRMRSADGGMAWQDLGTGTARRTTRSADGSAAFILTSTELHVSTDGFENHHSFPTPTIVGATSAMHFIDAKVGWLVNGTEVHHTRDGAATWRRLAQLESCSVRDVHFLDSLQGWVAGDFQHEAVLLRTSDGGNTWVRADTIRYLDSRIYPSDATVRHRAERVQFTDSARGWALDKYGRLLRSADAGRTWSEVPIPQHMNSKLHNDMVIVGDSTLWISSFANAIVRLDIASDSLRSRPAPRLRSPRHNRFSPRGDTYYNPAGRRIAILGRPHRWLPGAAVAAGVVLRTSRTDNAGDIHRVLREP